MAAEPPPDSHPAQPPQVAPEMGQPLADRARDFSVTPAEGALYQPLYTKRSVKTYAIQEHELDSLDDMVGNSKLWTSIGTGTASFAASCAWGMSQASTASSNGSKAFVALLFVVSAASFYKGHLYDKSRKTRLEKIIAQCKD